MENEKPLILVTNDDGIAAKGIRALVEVAQEFGDVVVVAPNSPQSGMGHAITINKILRLYPSNEHLPVEAYSCSGTPVDCVKLAMYQVLKKRPTLVLSGINHGANSSTNVLYSGTMSATIEGALEGIPSIGFSLLDHSADADFEPCKPVIRILVENALRDSLPKGVCLNVNIPKLPTDQIKGIKICRQGIAHWQDEFDVRQDPSGNDYFWLKGEFASEDNGEDTDMWALQAGYVSVVPTQYDLTAHHHISALNNWQLK